MGFPAIGFEHNESHCSSPEGTTVGWSLARCLWKIITFVSCVGFFFVFVEFCFSRYFIVRFELSALGFFSCFIEFVYIDVAQLVADLVHLDFLIVLQSFPPWHLIQFPSAHHCVCGVSLSRMFYCQS